MYETKTCVNAMVKKNKTHTESKNDFLNEMETRRSNFFQIKYKSQKKVIFGIYKTIYACKIKDRLWRKI